MFVVVKFDQFWQKRVTGASYFIASHMYKVRVKRNRVYKMLCMIFFF